MKKTTSWTTAGVALSVILGISGLGHLSATVFTLTVFVSVQAYLAIGFDALRSRTRRADALSAGGRG